MLYLLVYIILSGVVYANGNACELITVNNQSIHIRCNKPISKNDVRIYQKRSPDRHVLAFPKNWSLKTLPNNPLTFGEIRVFHNTPYLVIKKSRYPNLITEFRSNHLSVLKEVSHDQKCGWTKVLKSAFIIAIDPGHGGHDPGTVVEGIKEKNVALTFAKTLRTAFKKQKYPIKVILTREKDNYLSLDQRRQIAQKNHADLFISIHADGSPNSAARGLSVFTLSNAGASSTMARLLADKENKVVIRAKKALLSFDREININRSRQLSIALLSHLAQSVSLHTNQVEFANFRVLRSLNIPSCLIEIGFLSNEEDRALLLEPFYLNFLSNQVAFSIADFFKPQRSEMKQVCRLEKTNPWIVVKSGDNLSLLSKKHHISIAKIKFMNDLKSDVLRRNQKLYLS